MKKLLIIIFLFTPTALLADIQVSAMSINEKCKVWEQRPDTVRQFKEPCQCGVPRIFQGAA